MERARPVPALRPSDQARDLRGHTSKSLDQFLRAPWDYVITVCDSANERCPLLPGPTTRLHWSFDDPSQATGSEADRLQTFRRVRDEIGRAITGWLATGS